MTTPAPAHCETPELAAEVSAIAQRVGVSLDIRVTASTPDARGLWIPHTPPQALEALAAWSARARSEGTWAVGAFLAASASPLHALAADLGVAATWDCEAAVTVAGLLEAGGARAHRATRKALGELARTRLPPVPGKVETRAGRLDLLDATTPCWHPRGREAPVPLGCWPVARQVLNALQALEGVDRAAPAALSPHPERGAADEILFGPARRLSDPASKQALSPYGVPLPPEELCASPSRAASEAARMGFPVRITLASPDLRAWDEPDLRVDGVDNAARVRDVYRQLTTYAEERSAGARVLGVSVAQTRLARSLLSLRAQPLDPSTTRVELGFADPHGSAARDLTWLPVPCAPRDVARAVERLRGRALIVETAPAEQTATFEGLASLLATLHHFLVDFTDVVSEVRLHPVALLVGGGVEVREAAVSVTDAYTRDL